MKTIATWQATLGNSAHIVAAGAVGQAMQQEIDALRERNAELEADAKRLEWMDENGRSKVFSIVDNWYTRADYGQPYKKHKSLRDAIDAAMYRNGEKVDTSDTTCIDIGGNPV